MTTLKEHVTGVAKFQYFRDNALWYRTETNVIFPVPIEDVGTTTFDAEYKAIFLMRWIRKYLKEIEN